MKKILILLTILSTTLIFGFGKEVKASTEVGVTIFNNEIEWETYISILDGVGDPFELQVAKIKMEGPNSSFIELSYNNLIQFYNFGMPADVFQMYLLDDTYNHYFINSLDYRSWQEQLYLPLGIYQMFSLTGSPNVKISLFSSIWGDDLDISIDNLLGGYPNDSGNWFLVRNIKTIDQYSYDYGYDKGYEKGFDDGIPVGKQQGFDLGYDKGYDDALDDNAYEQ